MPFRQACRDRASGPLDPQARVRAGPARARPRGVRDRRPALRGPREASGTAGPPVDRPGRRRPRRGDQPLAVELGRGRDRARGNGRGRPLRRPRAAPPLGGRRARPAPRLPVLREVRRRAEGRVHPAAPVRHLGDDADRGGSGPHRDVPRARDPLALALRPHRPHRPPRGERGLDEVFLARRLQLRVLPLRRGDGVRRQRHDQDRHDGARPDGERRNAVARPPRLRAPRGRIRVQGLRRAVPHVDAGRLPGGTDPGDRLHVGRDEGRGVRAP